MCLAVPGQVVSVEPDALGVPTGLVSFGGITKRVCLAYLPDVQVGEYVMVHVGFALSRVDESEAREVFRTLEQLDGPGDPVTPVSPSNRATAGGPGPRAGTPRPGAAG